MEPLLEISTTPIQLEFRLQNARLQMKQPPAAVDIRRQKGGLQIHYKPGTLIMDTYDARSSMGLKSVGDAVREHARRGVQKAKQATAQIAKEGNRLAAIQNGGNAFVEIAKQRTAQPSESVLSFLPAVPVNIDWRPQEFSMQYEMDKLHYEWRTNLAPQMEFIPVSLEYFVKQYPEVDIEYTGDPLYVPPSSNPNYEPKFDVLV